MVESGAGEGLATETFNRRFVAGNVPFQHLDRDLSIEEGIVPQPYFGHTAAGDEALESVAVANEPWFEFGDGHDWRQTLVLGDLSMVE
jgi:hypothetical protein